MAKQEALFLTKEFQNSVATFENTDGITPKIIFTGGADDSIITEISICSTNTSSNILLLYRTIATVDCLIGSILIPTLSGTDGTTPRVNGLNATLLSGLNMDKDGNYFMQVIASQTIKAAVTVAVTNAKIITVVAVGKKY